MENELLRGHRRDRRNERFDLPDHWQALRHRTRLYRLGRAPLILRNAIGSGLEI
jgi:hypothetical protein